MTKRIHSLIFLLGFVLAGCRQDHIETYLAPKDSVGMPPVAPMNDQAGSPAISTSGTPAGPQITWKAPEGWEEQPASAMRVGSFLIKGTNGQTADVSVVPLSGEAGGDLANINRWRGQIQLNPLTEEELQQQSHHTSIHGRAMRWVDFVSDKPLGGTTYLRRITAVIYKKGDQTWFFKMTGDDATVRAAQPAFRQFIASTDYKDHE